MKSYKLSFGSIFILRNDLAEVIVDEGVEMNVDQAKEYLNFLYMHLEAPFSLLLNKKNSYSYTFEAQKLIVSNDKIKKLAVVVGSTGALMASETLLSLKQNGNWHTEFFRTREEAVLWLFR